MAINSSNLNFQPGIPPATPVTTALVPEAKTDLSSSVIPDGVMLSGTAQEVLDRAKANYLPNPATFWEAPLEQTTCQGEFPKPPNQDNFLQRRIKRLGYNAGRVFRSVGDGLGNEVGNSIRNPMRWTPVLGPSIRRLEAAGLPTPAPLVSLPGQEFVANTAESAIRGVGEFTASTSEDVTYAVAHPDKTLQGAYMVTNTLLANDPTMGPSIIQLESLATGKSYPEVWAEKRQNADNLKQAVVQDFNQTRDRVGLPGALVKTGLDLFGLPKAGAKTAITAGRIADNSLGILPGGPIVRRGLDSVHPDSKRRATARAERENFRIEQTKSSDSRESSLADIENIRENYIQQGLGEKLNVGGSEVTVRGLRTKREREVLMRDLKQVHESAGDNALNSFGELMLTDHPGVATLGSKVVRVAGFFAHAGDKTKSLVVIKRSALGNGTVAHELGHAVDATDPKMGVWVSESFDSPFGQGTRKSHVSDYATTDPFEDWAETFREVVTSPNKIRKLEGSDGALARKIKFMREYLEQRKRSAE